MLWPIQSESVQDDREQPRSPKGVYVSVFKSGSQNCHYDTPKSAQRIKMLHAVYDTCTLRQSLLKIIPLDSNTTYNSYIIYSYCIIYGITVQIFVSFQTTSICSGYINLKKSVIISCCNFNKLLTSKFTTHSAQ